MKNQRHVVVKDQTTQFIQHITSQLNHFFNKISRHGYSFECIHTENNKSDQHAIQLKKAYRTFKKYLISEKLIDPELGQKARQRFANRVWQQLNESQKYKYFTGKSFTSLHYLQRLVNNVQQRRQAHNRNQNGNNAAKTSNSKSQPTQMAENKNQEKKVAEKQHEVVVIE